MRDSRTGVRPDWHEIIENAGRNGGGPGRRARRKNAADDFGHPARRRRRRVAGHPAPLMPLSVSSDGEWIAVQDPRACGASIVYPTRGGSPDGSATAARHHGAGCRCRSISTGRQTASSCSGISTVRCSPSHWCPGSCSRRSHCGAASRRSRRSTAGRRNGHQRPTPVSRSASRHVCLHEGDDAAQHFPRARSMTGSQRLVLKQTGQGGRGEMFRGPGEISAGYCSGPGGSTFTDMITEVTIRRPPRSNSSRSPG